MNKIKTVIIDDELLNRELIEGFIIDFSAQLIIIGSAPNVTEGIKLIKQLSPQVVFLDIKMPDGTGFDLLSKLEKIDFEVVFITGYDDFALKAFDVNALDYVLKPIDPLKLKNTLKRVELRIEQKQEKDLDFRDILSGTDLVQNYILKIPLNAGNRVHLVSLNEIVYIKWENRTTNFFLQSGEKYISSQQLTFYANMFDHHPFILRINKKVFINVQYVKSYTKGSLCSILLSNGEEIEISRRKKTAVLDLLSNITNKYELQKQK